MIVSARISSVKTDHGRRTRHRGSRRTLRESIFVLHIVRDEVIMYRDVLLTSSGRLSGLEKLSKKH
jgi:hypothetical protein